MSFAAVLIGFLSIMVPGFFLALALLRKTKLNMFEIVIIGFIFGIIFPATMTWAEAYLMDYVHAFAFSAGLYNANVVILTIIGIALCYWQGALDLGFLSGSLSRRQGGVLKEIRSDYKERISQLRGKLKDISVDLEMVRSHEQEEAQLAARHESELQGLRGKGAGPEELQHVRESHEREERNLFVDHEREENRLISGEKETSKPSAASKTNYLVWGILIALMLVAFSSRIMNLHVAPHYFEFDPYFDMLSTQQILSYGYQLKLDYSAWPVNNGTVARIQPLIPYLEAYWYDLSNPSPNSSQVNINLLSKVSSVYPPIVAALLVFVVFLFVYHEYGDFPALIAAGLATAMPVLITTFIAGEQLVEPWGIFALFFMVATYALAAKHPKEKRYAILAGIAFASNFLGAHYYNVTDAVLAVYILSQGVVDTLRNKSSRDFFEMNAVVLLVIIIFYLLYAPYNATLTNRIPSLLGIPSIIAFPLVAFIAALLFEYLPIYLERYKLIKRSTVNDLVVRIGFIAVILLLAVFSPIGHPITKFLSLAAHFTTPNTPLFMTVQEYVVTGPAFNFGAAGLGIVGASVGGFPLLVWLVLILFGGFTLYGIFMKNSRSAIFTFTMVAVLVIAGMSEVKYLPHFGVGYIIAIGIIIGELYLMVRSMAPAKRRTLLYGLYAIGIIAVLAESGPLLSVFTSSGVACNKMTSSVAATMYCNTLTVQWLNALSWMRTNIGPYAPRILSWWDYGDWINWFGNSNAVIRGDNAVAALDYQVAAHFVLGNKDGYNTSVLAHFMDTTAQAKYVLFDDQLVPKWSALDFLACVNVNQTSRSYAVSQGQLYGQPFLTGTSPCELNHDPVELLIPEHPSLSQYCTLPNASITAVQAMSIVGQTVPSALNATYCVPETQTQYGLLPNAFITGTERVLYSNGTVSNIALTAYYSSSENLGQGSSAQPYFNFLAVYLPNAPNGTITNAPTEFYNSTYYKGFFLGKLDGFTLVYPKNFSGINMVNSTNTVMIFQIDNYTGTLPHVPPKPSWIHNNYSTPG